MHTNAAVVDDAIVSCHSGVLNSIFFRSLTRPIVRSTSTIVAFFFVFFLLFISVLLSVCYRLSQCNEFNCSTKSYFYYSTLAYNQCII